MGQIESKNGKRIETDTVNHLCDLCKRLQFDECPAGKGSSAGTLHHASSFYALRISAQNGCHLCSLFSSGLNLCRPIIGAHSASIRGEDGISSSPVSVGVTVEYFPSDSTHHRSERLEIRCGDRWVPLYLESYPTLSCLNSGYQQKASKEMSQYLGGNTLSIWRGLLQPPHPFCACGKGVWEPNLLLKGQTSYSGENPLSDAVVSQIRRWIQTCISTHSHFCGSSIAAKLPHRILDVGPSDGSEDPHLITPGARVGHYITLSYRWGDTHSLTTTSTTLADREAVIPLHSLPQTMRDAVFVARRLNIRYLWIDALCILQDSPSDWDTQSGMMGKIYRHAFLNISADVAKHSNAGFLATRNILEIRNCQHPTLVEKKKRAICPFVNTGDVICGINKNVLTQRGWIFPERLLSKRILHWSNHEVIWECNSHLASERHPAGLGDSRFLVDSNWNKIYGITKPLGDDRALVIHEGRLREWAARARAYAPWYELVREYSKRVLTKSSDKLPAISALAASFLEQLQFQNPYLQKPFCYLAGL